MRTQSKTICAAAVFQPYAWCCKRIFMKCMRVFGVCFVFKEKETEVAIMKYQSSLHNFHFYTPFKFHLFELISGYKSTFLERQVQKKKKCIYSPDRKERLHLSSQIFGKLVNLFTSNT